MSSVVIPYSAASGRSDGKKRKYRCRKCSAPCSATVHDYAAASSIHGVTYVFDRTLMIVERVLWTLVCIFFISLAIYWILDAYNNWTENPVITSVQTTGKQVVYVER